MLVIKPPHKNSDSPLLLNGFDVSLLLRLIDLSENQTFERFLFQKEPVELFCLLLLIILVLCIQFMLE